ncbi:Protein pob1 [Leucoagaricus sp. SymC.cos]|nr:Protein pob1 [Leucoagaricus sp. SymC.cos]
MTEYVYALHDFVPENEDEVPFKAGERIEVVEKDELYGDGWWQGRNLSGRTGLFPVSYTTPAPPSIPSESEADAHSASAAATEQVGPKSVLNTLPEESESDEHDSIRHQQQQRQQPEAGGSGNGAGRDEVMKATLTDVQKAIEQLGRNRGDNDDGGRSFSFASTRDDRDTDTDFDLSDLDGPGGGDGGDDVEGWHKGARSKLAEKARRAVEEAEKLQAMMGGGTSGERRNLAPPIEVELSDESEDEMEREGFTSRSAFQGIPEEDENELEYDGDSASPSKGTAVATPIPPTTPPVNHGNRGSLTLPPKDEAQLDTATATRSSFPASTPSPNILSAVASTSSSRSPEPQIKPSSPVSIPTHTRTATRSSFPASTPSPNILSAVASTSSSRSPEPQIKPSSPVSIPTHTRTGSTSSAKPTSPLPASTTVFTSIMPSPPLSATATAPRTMSPVVSTTSQAQSQSKHASVASAHSYRSSGSGAAGGGGAAALPAASPEPTSPLPPIPGSMPASPPGTMPGAMPGGFSSGNGHVPGPVTANVGAAPPVSSASPASAPAQPQQQQEKEKKKEKTHPSEWSLEEVIEWLKSKGFDQDVCDKFIEQEITGDVLLELDASLLKTELGIMAFGKRVRIANAINELKRPPSISYSDSPEMTLNTPITPQSQVHSRTQSQSQSHYSFPGSGQGQGQGPGQYVYCASPASAPAQPQQQQEKEKKKEKTHPSEWSLEEVIEWLKGKGFDQDVCDKFIEQEITGDVLLELDASLLKTELGIMAFGKRVRIANAINELKRPPSISYSDSPEMTLNTPITPQSQVHSRTQSQSQSHYSFPGSGQGQGQGPGQYVYTQSIQSSLGSPLGFGGVVGNGVNGFVSASGGGGGGGGGAQLSLSPSDSALKASATATTDRSIVHRFTQDSTTEIEDRGHMSDGEIAPASSSSMRRRLFGRSHDSASSSLKRLSLKAGDVSPVASPPLHSITDSPKDKEGNEGKEGREGSISSTGTGTRHGHGKGKRSIDGGRSGGERLSIFGSTFGGSLGKGRKPPPSASVDDSGSYEKTSMFSLPRLGSGSMRKSSSTTHRSVTPTGSPGKTLKEFGEVSSPTKREKGTKAQPSKERGGDSAVLRKRTVSSPGPNGFANGNGAGNGVGVGGEGVAGLVKPGQSILEQIGEPDHVGWMRKKGDRYNSWKNRYFVLKGPHMYCLRSDNKSETKIKGYIHVIGYKVSVDENLDPGRYGFRVDHDNDKTHYFSSDEKSVVRDWMKTIMKATIDRDFSKPVISSCNIPTIPLTVAQAMNPAPRPPSPTARAATQKALRRENPNQLSTRDAQILMGLSSSSGTTTDTNGKDSRPLAAKLNALNPGPAPPRPSREMRRTSIRSSVPSSNTITNTNTTTTTADDALIDWANSHLPPRLQIIDPTGPLCSGLGLLRLAESIKGKPASPPVPDSAFPIDVNDDKLDGLFRLFDFLLDNDVKMGNVSINDVRQEKREKVVQLLKALKAWEDKRRAIVQSFGKGAVQAGGFVAF